MSLESAQALYSRLTTDEAFRTQLEQAANKKERQQILQAAGYQFNQEEWEAATAQIQELNSTGSELTNAQLQAVSGGAIIPAYGLGVPIINNIKDLLS